MSDLPPIPGWECICDDGDVTLVQTMLSNHGITSEIVPVGARGKYSKPTLWVSATDYDRAAVLFDAMLAQLHSPTGPSWPCRYCGEHNEGQFDVCWKCGRDHVPGTQGL